MFFSVVAKRNLIIKQKNTWFTFSILFMTQKIYNEKTTKQWLLFCWTSCFSALYTIINYVKKINLFLIRKLVFFNLFNAFIFIFFAKQFPIFSQHLINNLVKSQNLNHLYLFYDYYYYYLMTEMAQKMVYFKARRTSWTIFSRVLHRSKLSEAERYYRLGSSGTSWCWITTWSSKD